MVDVVRCTPDNGGMSELDDTADAPATDDVAQPGGGGLRTLVVGVVAVVVVIGVALAFSGSSTPSTPTAPATIDTVTSAGEAGFGLTDAVDTLPAFTLEAFGEEGEVPVSSLLGGAPLVVNFWATWCAPCVAEMPDFEDLHTAAGDTVRLVGINTQDAALNAEPFVEDLGITYDLAVDRQGEYFALTGGFGMPTTLFVQPDGAVAYRHTGPLTPEQMRELVAEHLGVEVPDTPA